MAAIIIIPKTMDQITVAQFMRVQGQTNPGVVAEGLAGTEKVQILKSMDDGLTFEPVQQGGSALVLTATDNMYAIDSAGLYGVTKDGTAGLAGVFLVSDQQI